MKRSLLLAVALLSLNLSHATNIEEHYQPEPVTLTSVTLVGVDTSDQVLTNEVRPNVIAATTTTNIDPQVTSVDLMLVRMVWEVGRYNVPRKGYRTYALVNQLPEVTKVNEPIYVS